MRIAIVEDDRKNAETLTQHLERYSKENNRSMKIKYYPNGECFLKNFKPGEFSFVFMDIEMPGMDGMTVARKLREVDKNTLLLFVTNLAQYAVQGYEVQAFDFIVKPIQYYNFAMKLNRAFECLDNMQNKEFWISSRQGKKCIVADELKYVEVMGHTLIFHTLKEDVSGTGALKNVLEAFDGLSFSLCNRCYLVNLRYVTEVKDDIVLVGGDELKISTPKRKSFLSDLNNYIATRGNR